jgi:hypothetical protein
MLQSGHGADPPSVGHQGNSSYAVNALAKSSHVRHPAPNPDGAEDVPIVSLFAFERQELRATDQRRSAK